jgi:hypothetical protein
MVRRDIFAIDSSIYDLVQGRDVNFSRSGSMLLEQEIDGSVQLYPVNAYAPAFYPEDSSIHLEPIGQNFVFHNMNLLNPLWIKGSNIVVQPDEAKGPDGSYLADRVVWIPGTGNTQVLRYSMQLPAGQAYTMSGLLRLVAGQFAPLDVMRITGGVVGSPSVSLSFLNNFTGRYRFLEASFVTQGRQPTLPPNVVHDGGYVVSAVTTTTVTVAIPNYTVQAGDLVGGRAQFEAMAETVYYSITDNTASATGGSVTLTLEATNLILDGATVSTRLNIERPALQSVELEVYCERSAVMDWGGVQVEPLPFRTSMIYQRDTMNIRSGDILRWRNSPINGLKTFAVFVDLKLWRGDGNLLESGNFRLSINQSKLTVQAGTAIVTLPDPLPAKDVKIWVQVAEESATLRIAVNNILVARTSLVNYISSSNVALNATSEGVRALRTIVVMDSMLLDGEVSIGETLQQEAADLFNNPAVQPSLISSHQPLIQLNPVTIPGMNRPIANYGILSVNRNSRVVTVESGQGYINLQPVSILGFSGFATAVPLGVPGGGWGNGVVGSGAVVIARCTIEAIATIPNSRNVNITLDSVAGILEGHYLAYGNVDWPSFVSVRFPYDPVEQQTITEVTPATRTIKVGGSVLSFTETRAFVVSPEYADRAEVIIQSVNLSNNTMVLDRVDRIAMGDVIVQPQNELLIDPANYTAGILENIPGVRVGTLYKNGVIIENYNFEPVTVRPYIRPIF